MARTKNLWNKGFYIVSAILSMVFGVILIVFFISRPLVEGERWPIVLPGIIALVFGIIMLMFAFAIRRADKEVAKKAVKEVVEDVEVEVIEEPKAEN